MFRAKDPRRSISKSQNDSFSKTESVDIGFLQVDGDGLLNAVGLLEVEVGGSVGIAEGNLK